MINKDSAEALDILVDIITNANPGSSKFTQKNYNTIEKYSEFLEKSGIYDTEKNKTILNKLAPSRHSNQLKAEDLAKYAYNLNVARDYLLSEDKEMER